MTSMNASCERSWLDRQSTSHALVRDGTGVYIEIWIEMSGSKYGPFKIETSAGRGICGANWA